MNIKSAYFNRLVLIELYANYLERVKVGGVTVIPNTEGHKPTDRGLVQHDE